MSVASKHTDSTASVLSLSSLINDSGWKTALETELELPYMKELEKKLAEAYKTKQIFPPQTQLFNALNLTPLKQVKVVIIGQDPYHDDGQAMGLCFSVPKGIAVPPSLKNMYKELETDIPGFKSPSHGDLTQWADRGVLLLNATLSVQAHTPNSHKDYGWQKFTDKIIQVINENCKNVVFILWGNFAQKKGKLIDAKKHTTIKTGHPSPLSVKYFLGCKCFSKTNDALSKYNLTPIDWKLD
ncbi:uracil-DNA glycosylase isoform X2 [Patella vulgata]|uniref:uracil-DNA glycosylase isoform X2 n=1 Tax=Patella vulgata TaxID=6465 RepID=UPI0024A86987|nr:uracil-DNA glycosylase isoform X2 [Patella vulgata]